MNVNFYTAGGLKLAARLQVPASPQGPVPGVLLLPALLAGDHVLEALGNQLVTRGLAALTLDYRGCGDSEGEPGWLDPFMRLEDARHAVAWMAQCAQLDAGRLGVWGHRFSAPVAIGLAADEPRIKAVVGSSGPGSGTDFMRSLRTGAEWIQALDRVREDRLHRVLTGQTTMVPLEQIVPMQGFLKSFGAGPAEGSRAPSAPAPPNFRLASLDAIMRFHTEDLAARLGPTPLLLVAGQRDEVVLVEDVTKVYDAVKGPKRMVVLPGLDHAGMEKGTGLEQQLALAQEWFLQHL